VRTASPLRYPGGKWRVARFFERLVMLNYSNPPVYIEPYAGGASLALTLLFRGFVSRIFLNDLDPAVHAFWQSILKEPAHFTSLVMKTPITPREWHKQKQVYESGQSVGTLALAFAMFFLNRTSHSGILNGGMIGGRAQKGPWKIDARFNRIELANRIQRIQDFGSRIHISGADALTFINRQHGRDKKRTLIYLDPPYFRVGRDLYLNAYGPDDHRCVRDTVCSLGTSWVVSYDDVPEIRSLYRGVASRRITLMHSARDPRIGNEVMFFSEALRVPRFVKYRYQRHPMEPVNFHRICEL
jgi:DNA adenine methylase